MPSGESKHIPDGQTIDESVLSSIGHQPGVSHAHIMGQPSGDEAQMSHFNPYTAKAGDKFGGNAPDKNAGFAGSRPSNPETVTGEAQDTEGGGFAVTTETKGSGLPGDNGVGETHYFDRTGKEDHTEVAGPETGYHAGVKGLATKRPSSVAARGGADLTAGANAGYAADMAGGVKNNSLAVGGGGTSTGNMAPESEKEDK